MKRQNLLYPIYFASGLSALILETLWFRQAGLAFGNSVWASSLVLSSFMAGLALGSALAVRYGDRFKYPILLYVIAELLVALSGAGLVYGLPALGAVLAPRLALALDHPWLLNPFRLAVAFVVMVIPSTAMGVTLPCLTSALTRDRQSFGAVLGRLYGCNTLGAVAGALLGEAWLVGLWGVRGTALAAAALSVFSAAASACFWRRSAQAASPRTVTVEQNFIGKRWLAAAFLSGFCLLALETLWFRFLLLFVSGHPEVFAWMLAVVLAGLALGSLAASVSLRRWPDAHRYTSLAAFATGVLCVLGYSAFPLSLQPFLNAGSHKSAFEIFRLSVPLMLPVACMSGLLYPWIGAVLRSRMASNPQTVGLLTLVNTLGAACGPLFGVFVFLPRLGMEKSFFLIAVLYGAIGFLVQRAAPRRMAWVGVASLVLCLLLFPFGFMRDRFFQVGPMRMFGPQDHRIAAVREGLTETIVHVQALAMGRPLYDMMFTDYHPMSGTNVFSQRYQKLYVYWPLAVRPDSRRALLICYGVGNTAKALTDSRGLETIDIVDISRDVLETNDVDFPNPSENPLRDPRVRVHVEDGRYYLRSTPGRFDLITAEPPPPAMAGAVNLYSREYFQLLHDHLSEGGIVTYWLPLSDLSDNGAKAILRAFCDAFEDCSLWNGAGTQLMMVGTRNASGPVPAAQFSRQWNDPRVAPEMKRLGVERPEQLGALFIGDAPFIRWIVGGAPPVVDDYPRRIDAPFSSARETGRVLNGFTDAIAARGRFQASALIRRLWPESLRTSSLPYFEFQALINDCLYNNHVSRSLHPDAARRVLTGSPLMAPVLWTLGSDADIQRVLDLLTPAELARPNAQYELGLRRLSERNYPAAVTALQRAAQSADVDVKEAALRLLDMIGRLQA